MCTGEMFNKITGIKLCGNLRLPLSNNPAAPRFLLQGPSHVSLTMENADTHRSYIIEAKVDTLKERRDTELAITHVAKFAFDTPGSRVDRRFLAEYNIDRAAMSVNGNLRCPWKEASIEGHLTNTNAVKSASIEMTVDGTKKYSARAEVAVDTKGEMMIYEPKIIYSTPNSAPITLDGKVKFQYMQELDVDLKLMNLFTSPVTLSGKCKKTQYMYIGIFKQYYVLMPLFYTTIIVYGNF
jgi:hypothetical protein